MSTDLTTTGATGLAITAEQTNFSPEQRAVLAHMGVENAPDADLQVFMHVCQRTGLDPFARQIHMIGRNTKDQRTQQWVTKYTIQTGIDGYRVIGHRAADRTRSRISVEAPEWATEDGRWMPVWSKKWGNPVAARVTIRGNGDPFTAVAIFDEYAQTKRDGGLTSMWAQRPAGQLAKCAEALAWRMAFPHDLAGIYVEEEMQQADNRQNEDEVERPRGLDAVRAAAGAPVPPAADETVEATIEPDETGEALTARTRGHMFALFNELGVTERDDQIAGIVKVIGRPIESRKELTEAEGRDVVLSLEAWKAQNAGTEA